MTTQKLAEISTETTKRFSVRRLLRSAIAAGVVATIAGQACAQTELALPSFPTDTASLALPCSQDAAYPFVPSLTCGQQTCNRDTAAMRLTRLVGLKKRSSVESSVKWDAPVTMPTFPSTSPAQTTAQAWTVPSSTEQINAPNSKSPTLFLSTGSKLETSKQSPDSDTVVLASANENATTTTPAVIVPAPIFAEDSSVTEAASDGESLTESLIDIEIPTSLIVSTQALQQRAPELMKRPPAMQLQIGKNEGQGSTNKFSLSDSDSPTSITSEPKPVAARSTTVNPVAAAPMNVQIEGESKVGVAIPKPSLQTATLITEAASPSAPKKVQAVVEKQTGQMATIEASSRHASHRSVSDKDSVTPKADSPQIGERLEVGLHESTNVETVRNITGLSVEHPELCQVLKSGERSVSFVGLKVGQTRVALFTTDASGERKIEIREVIIAGAENRQADMKSLAKEIGQTVHSMYPNSHIEVIAEAEGLTVQGYAGSEEEAKRIIGLVRRTSLQPVVDRLATYK